MELLIFTSILFAIVVFILTSIIKHYRKTRNWGKGTWALLMLTPLVFLLLLAGSFVKINANEVGIIYDDRHGLLDDVKYEGFQTKSIFEHITTIRTTNRTAYLEVYGQTKDSINALFEITIIYRIEAQDAGRFFRRTSSADISDIHMNSIAKEALQSSTIKNDVYGILGEDLENVRLDFVNTITNLMYERYYITVVSASFDDIDAGSRIEEIIQRKGEALQEIEIARAEQRKVEIENETEITKAEKEAEIVKIAARAQAEKVEIEKTAISDMIKAYSEHFTTLTEAEVATIILQQIFFETWDGKLPEVLTGDSLSAFIGSLITNNDN